MKEMKDISGRVDDSWILQHKDNLDAELYFTGVYKDNIDKPIAVREAICVAAMHEHFLVDPQEGDMLAGRVNYPFVGFGAEPMTMGSLYYCSDKRILQTIEENSFSIGYLKEIHSMMDFWNEERYISDKYDTDEKVLRGKMYHALPEQLFLDTNNYIAEMGGRMAGVYLDYKKLIKLGLCGLRDEVRKVEKINGNCDLYDGMLMALDNLEIAFKRLANRCIELAKTAKTDKGKKQFDLMANTLLANTEHAPKTLREGLQLHWMYSVTSAVVNYGRMDEALGELLQNDINSGTLTKGTALELLQAYWLMIHDRRIMAEEIADFNSRIVLGGKDIAHLPGVKLFDMLAMEATRTVIEAEPQLTLRCYKGMDVDVMNKAIEVIGEGRTFPMLYNDDINIPAVMNVFNVSTDTANHYLPYGCGEYSIDHMGVGSPNCSFNLVKILEVILNGGEDSFSGKHIGVNNHELSYYDTFQKLWNSYAEHVDYYTKALSQRQKYEYEVESSIAPFNLCSMLFDDCIKRGKSINDGGARFTGGIIETFGMVNAADSLTAIKKLVFDDKKMTLKHLVNVLNNNFEDFGRDYLLMLNAPKYGNDLPMADEMMQRLSNYCGQAAMDTAKMNGFDYYGIVNINNYGNVTLGKRVGASADGRKSLEPLANGSTPTAGRDKNGITAMMKSLASINPNYHAGYSHNMKFSKQMFKSENIDKTKALIEGYFEIGGTQSMITVVNRGDLEDALMHPQKHHNLIVRVGGFSARFVELDHDVQMDLLKRTTYEV